MTSRIGFYAAVMTAQLFNVVVADDARMAQISQARKDANGFLVHSVESMYQRGETQIRVLLPDRQSRTERRRVLYVLPVEAANGNRYGDGLLEISKHDLHNKYRLICVYPTFSHLPWYADHPTDAQIRQESYFLKVVIPFIDKAYGVSADPKSRLLVGFSKSGWGAFSLLLRNPDIFGNAAAWDAPLTMERPDRFGMGPIFGTQQNFEKYRIVSLFEKQSKLLRQHKRLILLGYAGFRDHHRLAHSLMNELGIRHVYRDGPERLHRWDSGWLLEAVDLLAEATRVTKGPGSHSRSSSRIRCSSCSAARGVI